MKSWRIASPWRGVALALTLALAAFLRLTRLDLAPFCVDQVSVLRMVEGILAGDYFPLRGPDIGPGVFEWGTLGPLEYYIQAPLSAISRPLLGPVYGPLTAFVGLGLLGFLSLYRLGERHFGAGVGVVACALYAVAPYPFFLARELMDHSYLAAVVPLFFLALCESIERRSVGWAVVACGALACALQFHITTVVFLPLLVAVLLYARVPPRGWLLGFAVAALIYAPYLYAQVTEGFPDVRQMLGVARGEGLGIPPERAGMIVPRLLGEVLHRTGQTPDVDTPWLGRTIGSSLVAGTAAGLLLALGRAAWSLRKAPAIAMKHGIVAAWLVLPVVFLAAQRSEIYARHLALVYPAPYLLAALVAAWLFPTRERLSQRSVLGGARAALAIALVGCWMGLGLWMIRHFQRDVERGALVAGKLTLGVEDQLARTLLALGASPATPDLLALAGGGQELEGLYYLMDVHAKQSPRPPPGHEGDRFLVVAPTDVLEEPVLPFLEPLGWTGGVGIIRHAPSLAPESVRIWRNGEPVERLDLTSYGTAEPGPVRIEGRITKHPGERTLLIVDTHLCIERIVVGDVAKPGADCAGADPLPWPVRMGFAIPDEVAPGEHLLRIEAHDPAKRLFLGLFDVTVPAAGLPPGEMRDGLRILTIP